jgi:hypothetical protein
MPVNARFALRKPGAMALPGNVMHIGLDACFFQQTPKRSFFIICTLWLFESCLSG